MESMSPPKYYTTLSGDDIELPRVVSICGYPTTDSSTDTAGDMQASDEVADTEEAMVTHVLGQSLEDDGLVRRYICMNVYLSLLSVVC